MKSPLLYLLEVLFCSGMLLAFYRLLLVRRVAFVHCRRYLVAAMVLSVVIPALSIPIYPARTVVYPLPLIGAQMPEPVVLPADGTVVSVAGAQAEVEAVASIDWVAGARIGVVALYVSTTVVLLALLVVRLRSIRRLRRNSRLSEHSDYTLAENPEVTTPFSFLRTIFLGDDCDGPRREVIVCHERSHICHRHSAERITVEVIRILFWFNPFVWIASRWLQEVQEWEADCDVLESGYDLTEYRTILFRQLFGYNPDIACGLNHSLTKNRFAMMTQSKKGRFVLLRLGAVVPVVAGMMMLCSFTTRTPEDSDNSGQTVQLPATKPVNLSNAAIGSSNFVMSGEKVVYYEGGKNLLIASGKLSVTRKDDPTWKVVACDSLRYDFTAEKLECFGNVVYTEKEGVLCSAESCSFSNDGKSFRVTNIVGTSGLVIEVLPDHTIRVDGKPATLAALQAKAAAQVQTKPGEGVVIVAAPGVKMSLITDIKDVLRKAGLLRLMYFDRQTLPQDRMLPPDPNKDKSVNTTEIKMKNRNLFLVLINANGKMLAGAPGQQNIVTADELTAKVEAFILNTSNSSSMSEHRNEEFTLPDGRKVTYPVSQGVVSIQTTRDTSFGSYLSALKAITDAYASIRNDLSQKWLGEPYVKNGLNTEVDAERREVVNKAVPMNISEAEPRK